MSFFDQDGPLKNDQRIENSPISYIKYFSSSRQISHFSRSFQVRQFRVLAAFLIRARQLVIFREGTLGAVTHTKVNAISQGKLSLGASHLGFKEPC